MNVLWTKGKFHKIFSTENVNLHASGDGAASGRCCRLCGGDSGLRPLADSYVWEGVEERYDQLLYDCFGVRVSATNCVICEWCVRQLRSTERFKALVHAAFDKPPSSSIPSNTKVPNSLSSNDNVGVTDNKEIIELLKAKMTNDSKKKIPRRHIEKPSQLKRTNVKCKNCGQSYIMMMTAGDSKEFVCSRCKKNDKINDCKKSNQTVPGSGNMKVNMGTLKKADLREKIRQVTLLKKPSETKRQEGDAHVQPAKFKCFICPKKYATAEHLAQHMKLVHGERRKTVCVLCGKNFRTKELLDKHIQLHIDLKHFNNLNSNKLKRTKT